MSRSLGAVRRLAGFTGRLDAFAQKGWLVKATGNDKVGNKNWSILVASYCSSQSLLKGEGKGR